jgi:phenylpropionate dioxygenase-like ring-hydroxylating dioxygenase large terminal subunit
MASQAENKFKCPCHGSQYNAEGKMIRGPAPLVREDKLDFNLSMELLLMKPSLF